MSVLGVVGGHSILRIETGIGPAGAAARARRRTIGGDRGPVTVLDAGEYVVLQRHGLDEYVPAHRIDHARNLAALVAAGCDRVVALSSVGSLRSDLDVGAHLVPDDFIALDRPPTSVHDDERCHVVPGFTPAWRGRVADEWRRVAGADLVEGGVYWQANGPRFETPAEIRFIAAFADVVGMTVGSECTAANELGLDYAAVCVVDNLANGLGDELLTPEQFAAGKRASQEHLLAVLPAVVDALLA
jgi:5'-methylthioadenosine phosphorylase